MNVVKYRSWISSIQKFVYFENGKYSYTRPDGVNVFNWDNAEQWIGLCDKSGKEIFAGDIVETGYGFGRGIITYHYHYVAVERGNQWCEDFKYSDFQQFEVIGNRHENKDLL